MFRTARRIFASVIGALAITSTAALWACNGGSIIGPVATGSSDLAKICDAGAPLIQTVNNKALSPEAANFAAYANSACTANGLVQPALAGSADQNTPKWLEDVLTGLAVAAKVAPIVLPLIAG